MDARALGDLRADRPARIERAARVLEDDTDLCPVPPPPSVRASGHALPVDERLTRGQRLPAGEDVGDRRLARARLADEPGDLPGGNDEADVVEGDDPAARGAVDDGGVPRLGAGTGPVADSAVAGTRRPRGARRPRGTRHSSGTRRPPRRGVVPPRDDRGEPRHGGERLPGVGRGRVGEDPGDRTRLDDAAVLHHGHAVGDVGDDAHVVGDEEDGLAGLRLGEEEVEDARLHGDVEGRGRLVGDEDLR